MKKVIFDLDGTLFEASITVREALLHTLAEFQSVMVEDSAAIKAIGMSTERFLKEILPGFERIEKFKERFQFHEREAIKSCGKVFDGVKEMLQELIARNYQIFICSNGSREYIELVLKNTGIEEYVTDIVSSKFCLSKGEAIKQIITGNDFSIVVGDTLNDFLGAKAVSIPSIAVSYGYGSEEEYQEAAFLAKAPSEVLDFICLAEVFHSIADRLICTKEAKVIGINGADTSGKSIFTSLFSKYLASTGVKNSVLSMDDYHNPAKIRYQGENEVEAYYNNAFNYRQVIDEVLEPLKRQDALNTKVCRLNLDTDRYENIRSYNIDTDAVLLVEGVLLFRHPLLPYFDGKVYLQIGFDEVLKRAELRDVPKYGVEFLQKYRTKYIPVQQRYIKECRPMEISDVVIDNTDFRRPFFIL